MAFERERGVALLMAVVAVAFIAILAVAMLAQQNRLLRRVENNIRSDEALQIAYSGEQIAAQVLRQDWQLGKSSNNDFDFNEAFLRNKYTFPIFETGGVISSTLNELNDRFNVNNLVDKDGKINPLALAAFKQLLNKRNLPVELGDYLADWIDADKEALSGGQEDDFYQNLPQPYLSANQPLLSSKELLQVRGFNEIVYDDFGNAVPTLEALLPYICVLPVGSKLNVNTALPEVLSAYLEYLSADKLAALIKSRPFYNIKDFQTDRNHETIDAKGKTHKPDFKNLLPLAVSSEYFSLDTVVQLGRINIVLYSIIKRDSEDGSISLVLRSKGKT